MSINLPGLHASPEHHVLRKVLAGCCTLALGTALVGAGFTPAGAATQLHPAKHGSFHLLRHLPSAKAGDLPAFAFYVPITNGYDGLCMDAETDSGGNPNENGDKVQLWTCNSGAVQQYWNISATIGAYGPLTNEYGNHLCLDAESDGASNPSDEGDRVQLWSCSGASNQQWELASVSNGSYAFINEYDTSTTIVLAAENDSNDDPTQCGDNVQVQTWTGFQTEQTWNFGDDSSQCS